MTTGKTTALTRWTFVSKVMSLLFNTLSRLVITFLPRSKCLLISSLQSPSAVILEPKKIVSRGGARWGCGGKRHPASGERVPKPLAAWTAQAGEGTKRTCNQTRAFVEDPKTGTALNAGPAPYRAAGSLSSVDGESTDTPVRGKPSVTRTRWVLSTQRDICLPLPALPIAGLNCTSEPK